MIQNTTQPQSTSNSLICEIIKELNELWSVENMERKLARDIHRCYMQEVIDELHERRVTNLCHVDSTYKLAITEKEIDELNAIGYTFSDIFTEPSIRV
jgi:hypothetical protein